MKKQEWFRRVVILESTKLRRKDKYDESIVPVALGYGFFIGINKEGLEKLYPVVDEWIVCQDSFCNIDTDEFYCK